jgi:hypothetical protein
MMVRKLDTDYEAMLAPPLTESAAPEAPTFRADP